MGYYGDLSHKISSAKINVPAYQLSIGRNISPSLALTCKAAMAAFQATTVPATGMGQFANRQHEF
jgi:hypothetical protein